MALDSLNFVGGMAAFIKAQKLEGDVTDVKESINQLKKDAVIAKKLTDPDETMASILERLREANENGEHFVFDTSEISEQMFLCTIYIDDYDSPTRYRISDDVTGRVAISSYSATETIGEALEKSIDDYVLATVSCVGEDMGTISGVEIVLSNKDTGVVLSRTDYDGQPVSIPVPMYINYRITMDGTAPGYVIPSPDHVDGQSTIDFSVNIVYRTSPHTIGDLKYYIQHGYGNALKQELERGELIQFPDTWVSTDGQSISDPWDLADVRTVVGEDGEQHTAAIVMRHYATHNAVVFDQQENTAATEVTAQEGWYYYGKSGDTITLLSLSTGDTIPYSSYDAVLKTSIKDSTGNICKYGYNRWSHSFYRQWLNSGELKGTYWVAKHDGDVAPAEANGLDGYMRGCSQEILDAAKPIIIRSYTNNVSEPDKTITKEDTLDTFWLPSGEEMYGSVNADEGGYFPLVKNNTGLTSPSNAENAGRIYYRNSSHTNAEWLRLRSATRGYSCSVWYVYAAGSLGDGSLACGASRSVPACAIY